MSPQRQNEKLVKIYEILPEGTEKIDKTESEGFEDVNFDNIDDFIVSAPLHQFNRTDIGWVLYYQNILLSSDFDRGNFMILLYIKLPKISKMKPNNCTNIAPALVNYHTQLGLLEPIVIDMRRPIIQTKIVRVASAIDLARAFMYLVTVTPVTLKVAIDAILIRMKKKRTKGKNISLAKEVQMTMKWQRKVIRE